MTSTGTNHYPTTIRARAGIDCAITANHQCELIEYRDDGTEKTTRATIPSTAAGMDALTRLLTDHDHRHRAGPGDRPPRSARRKKS